MTPFTGSKKELTDENSADYLTDIKLLHRVVVERQTRIKNKNSALSGRLIKIYRDLEIAIARGRKEIWKVFGCIKTTIIFAANGKSGSTHYYY